MAIGAAVFAGIAAVTAVTSAVFQNKAAKARNKAERRARRVEERVAAIQGVRRKRLAIARGRVERARLTAQAEAGGLGRASSFLGAIGSIQTQTASNIGFAATQEAANILRSRILEKGFAKGARLGAFANIFGAVASSSQAVGGAIAGGAFGGIKEKGTTGTTGSPKTASTFGGRRALGVS